MLKKNKRFLLLILGAAVLLVGSSVAAYWLLVQRKQVLGEAPVGSELIPQDALFTASVSTDSAQWQQMQLYGTPETKAALEKQLTQLGDNLLTANGFNYERDIRPLLGKTLMMAYLGSRKPVPGTPQGQLPLLGQLFPPDVIVLPLANPIQARQLFDKTKSQKATQFFERTYKGILIRETHKSNSQNFSLALLGRFVVVTTNPKLTEQVIDTSKGGSSIATTPGYREELPNIKAVNSFAQLYLNVPRLSAGLAANSSASLSPEKIAASQQMQGVAATVALEPQGMRFQGISWLRPNSSHKYKVENTTPRLARRLSADTLLMFSGGNLAQLWKDYAQGAQFNPLLQNTPAQLNAGLRAIAGLDFEQDLLPWMGDEFSLALIPASPELSAVPDNPTSPPLGAGVVLMVEASDRSRAEATLKRLDQIMATRYGFQVQETKVGGISVVNWTSPFGGVNAVHGWLEGNVVFLTLGAPIARGILPKPQVPLIQAPLFQQVLPIKPDPNNGQFFLDVERTLNSGNLNLAQSLPPDQKLIAKAIRAIGFTGAIQDRHSTRFELFVQLKTAVIPSPTPLPEIPSVQPISPSATPKRQPSPSSSLSKSPTPQSSSSSPSAQPTPEKLQPSNSPSVTATPQIKQPKPSSSTPSVSPTPQPSASPSL
jgi:hypothetical protein